VISADISYIRHHEKPGEIAMTNIILSLFLSVLIPITLGGCGVAVGAGAAASTAAMEERGLSTAIDDKLIQARINAKWLETDPSLFLDLSSSVHEGRVLLAGNVEKPEHRIAAVRIAWAINGVREVINQIEIHDRSSVVDLARDAWITTKLTIKLTVDNRIKAINYSIDTVNGHVFIMGIAQDKAELERVQAHAQDVGYVRRVTSYTVLKNDTSRRLNVKVPPDTTKK